MPPRLRPPRSPSRPGGASAIDALVRNNRGYAAKFAGADLPAAPSRGVAVVTCMDARMLPSRLFGLAEGDAHVIRNAGGSAREALRSLVVSQQLLGTREVAVVKHTDCGMLGLRNRDLHEKIRHELGADAHEIDFLPFSSLEQAVLDDLAFLRSSPLVAPQVRVRGFVYDVRSGLVSEVGAQP
ncbi:MAG TPA: carbonic anhydrase [Solirubrobacteraceae bacterium]|nr:carbonic anhydrase [Solirubrobacteraceae bacterium]